MHDGIELVGQLRVDRRDGALEGAGDVLVEHDGAGERLLDQVLHQVLRLVGGRLLGRRDDLIEEGKALGRLGRGRRRCGLRF